MRILAFTYFCLITSVVSDAQVLIPRDKIGEEIQSFYQKPSSLKLETIIKSIDSDKEFAQNMSGRSPILGFFATAFTMYSNEQNKFTDIIRNLSNCKGLMQSAMDLSKTKDTILNWQNHSPETNDLLWGGFFASGDSRYLKRLATETTFSSDTTSLVLYLAGSTAKWSLCANSRNYAEVKSFLEGYSKEAPEDVRSNITEILRSTPGRLKELMTDGLARFKKTKK